MKRAFTTREKVMLLVLTVLLIVIAYFKLILEPINNSIDEYQSETAAEQDEILQNTAFDAHEPDAEGARGNLCRGRPHAHPEL